MTQYDREMQMIRRQSGCRSVRRSQTGTLVSVFDAREEGLNETSTRWAVYCEDHVSMYEAKTLAEARDIAPTLIWCDHCQSALHEAAQS